MNTNSLVPSGANPSSEAAASVPRNRAGGGTFPEISHTHKIHFL